MLRSASCTTIDPRVKVHKSAPVQLRGEEGEITSIPIKRISLPRRRRQPLLQHDRYLFPDLPRYLLPLRPRTESEWLEGGGAEGCGQEGHGFDVGGEHRLWKRSQFTS